MTHEEAIMIKKFLSALSYSTMLTIAAHTATADIYGVALFDDTASMMTTREADGLTRCEYAKTLFLEQIGFAIQNWDYLDARTFSSPGAMTSITNGFVYVKNLQANNGAGAQLLSMIETAINEQSCNGWSTALGDAICDSMDDLREEGGKNDSLGMGIITDAGENHSVKCGGRNYIDTHITPKSNINPKVRVNIAVLKAPYGNVGRSLNYAPQDYTYEYAPASNHSMSRGVDNEAEKLVLLAKSTGGEAMIISDDETCVYGCSFWDGIEAVVTNDPWGGAW